MPPKHPGTQIEMGRGLDSRAERWFLRRVAGLWKAQARRRMLSMPIRRRLRLGALPPLPLRACSPLLGARLRTSFLRVLILFRPTHQWRLVMQWGLALGSLRHRGVYGLLIVWGRCLGQRRVVVWDSTGEYEGLTPSYSHFPPSPNLAISTNGNGTGSGDVI